jgi:hypothetical protein
MYDLTVDEVFAHAGRMAIENRVKDEIIGNFQQRVVLLEEENRLLKQFLAANLDQFPPEAA